MRLVVSLLPDRCYHVTAYSLHINISTSQRYPVVSAESILTTIVCLHQQTPESAQDFDLGSKRFLSVLQTSGAETVLAKAAGG